MATFDESASTPSAVTDTRTFSSAVSEVGVSIAVLDEGKSTRVPSGLTPHALYSRVRMEKKNGNISTTFSDTFKHETKKWSGLGAWELL